jgi:hypothetical protein
MQDSRFHFTIADFARLIGKSPVTLRQWERQKIISFPREGSDRKFYIDDVVKCAEKAHALKRIPRHRLDLVIGAMSLLRFIEFTNRSK